MTTIELSPAGWLRITYNGHTMDFPVSEIGANLLSQTLTGIAKGAPSQWLINKLVQDWVDTRPKYVEPDFMKDIEL